MSGDMVLEETAEVYSGDFPHDTEETVEAHCRSFPSCSQETAPCSNDTADCTGPESYGLEDEDEAVQNHNDCHSDAGLTCLPTLWKQEAIFAKRIDKTCRALFPVMFIIFNIIYWVYYQVFT